MSYFARLLSCATWLVQDLPESRMRPRVSVFIHIRGVCPISSTSWLVTCVLSETHELFTVLQSGFKTQGDRLFARGGLPEDVNEKYAALSGYKMVQGTH